ncbi:hypothetical protein J3R83DRAFT_3379 [Lanmaoa asiatica]|nr:hypothetical protein J3R83DRAFT_3379 [Lanmaoa asiatica]
MSSPIPGFHIPFHKFHIEELSSLHDTLSSNDIWTILSCIHSTILSLLRYLSLEALCNDHRDLFTLFLVAYHLRDDAGNTTKASAVPPNISTAQWCFRATAILEVLSKAPASSNPAFLR